MKLNNFTVPAVIINDGKITICVPVPVYDAGTFTSSHNIAESGIRLASDKAKELYNIVMSKNKSEGE